MIGKWRERATDIYEGGVKRTFGALKSVGSLFVALDESLPTPDWVYIKRKIPYTNIEAWVDIKTKVDPTAVRSTAEKIVDDQPSRENGNFSYREVAEIHRYVNENISYGPDPDGDVYIAPPEETLEEGAGDCDCQAVLVASLLEAIGATTRIAVCVSTDGGGHALSEVRLADSSGSETQKTEEALRSYYDSMGYTYNDFYFEADDDGIWYPADTASGRYVGDIGQLSEEGFIHEKDDGSWEWHDAEYYYP
jgi:transglutaminase-like putative cysteine protease